MTANHYAILAALISLVAVLQVVRALNRWPVTIATTSIPVWASWAAFIVAVILASLGFSTR